MFKIMKSLFVVLICISILTISSSAIFANNSNSKTIILQIGKLNIIENNQTKKIDTSPYLLNGRTMVPIRFISESLGAEVKWNQKTNEVTILFNNNEIKLKINTFEVFSNNKTIKLESYPEIKNNRTMVPLRFISEAMGSDVKWDNRTQTITINSNNETNTDTTAPNTSNEDSLTIINNILTQLYNGFETKNLEQVLSVLDTTTTIFKKETVSKYPFFTPGQLYKFSFDKIEIQEQNKDTIKATYHYYMTRLTNHHDPKLNWIFIDELVYTATFKKINNKWLLHSYTGKFIKSTDNENLTN